MTYTLPPASATATSLRWLGIGARTVQTPGASWSGGALDGVVAPTHPERSKPTKRYLRIERFNGS